MGLYPNIYLLVSVIGVILFAVTGSNKHARFQILLVISLIFVTSLSLFLLILCLFLAFIVRFGDQNSKFKSLTHILIPLLCLATVLLNDFQNIGLVHKGAIIMGSGFLGIRAFLLFDGRRKGKHFSFSENLLFLSFFPVFVAGPIDRPASSIEAMTNISPVSVENFSGIGRFLFGFVKLYMFGAIVNSISAELLTGMSSSFIGIWLFCIGNWFSLYLVYSGSADIAISTGQLFGVKVPENFNSPFLARSIAEYWQRWNITLMSVVSEYVYKKFVRKTGKRIVGFYVSFTIMGIWHEVSWHFVMHGLIHASSFAIFFVYSRSTLKERILESVNRNQIGIYAYDFCCQVLTITIVSIASSFGTAGLLHVLF